ncbi:carboxypeptidase M32 [Periweissella ghanensis]|uniref:Metal-dependent carboxypeptidase n=1 Tax=Periweissella ghanensis TaxID=467997 RepID=A0ABM8ZAX5_9LACO|nr:carboxypeptidase M32 [Periweissella ghanensis]CAH0418469.1 Carboxypeptidase 1 [Periweissella ghanensis]
MGKYTEADLRAVLKEISLLEENQALLGWDSLTGMPEDAAPFRAELLSYLAGKSFELQTGSEYADMLTYFEAHPTELSDLGQQLVIHERKKYDLNAKIPAKDFIEYQKITSLAQDAWTKAREAKDFAIFAPYLAQIIAYKKQFIGLWDQGSAATPYDVLLDQYEPGLTVAKLDQVFGEVKAGLSELQAQLALGEAPDNQILSRFVSKQNQSDFSMELAQKLGYSLKKGRLDDTIHPFMEAMNRNDARITTRWDEHDFQMAVLGILHEAGHGLFEQNISPEFDYTPFEKDLAMSIHESQSLFNEVMMGRSEDFWRNEYPRLQAYTGATFADIDFDTFYRAWMVTKPTLIRTEADPLTYPLHIIIRYEIEKAIFNDNVDVNDLPALWNAKYLEYLGIEPENDLVGILQDIHWAGGDFGYFPSYALGHLYAAQFFNKMEQDLDLPAIFASQDYTPIFNWRKEYIWQYGASKTPQAILEDATGESLNPQYWLALQTKIYRKVYGLN